MVLLRTPTKPKFFITEEYSIPTSWKDFVSNLYWDIKLEG
jgi:hypothetical protein